MVTLYNFASAETWAQIQKIAGCAHTPSHEGNAKGQDSMEPAGNANPPAKRARHIPKTGFFVVRLAPGHTVSTADRQTSRRIRGVFNLAKSMCIALGFDRRERLAMLAAERPKVRLVGILTEFAATESSHGAGK